MNSPVNVGLGKLLLGLASTVILVSEPIFSRDRLTIDVFWDW
jgi:hypothetical protein